jgi:putative N6-adenine-specific DNA methylase
VVEDRFTLSLDSSGDPLYKRGFKSGPARAPIRETLAAAILMSAGYDWAKPLVDPMCGSGTFSLEAAMLAKRLSPGINRDFAFMGWPAYAEKQWTHLKHKAEAAERRLDRPLIFASDIDAQACERLVGHVAANDLSDAVRVAHKDLFACEAHHYGGGPGLVTINPPYGIRLGSAKAAEDLFRRICRHLKEAFRGWDVALIAPERGYLKSVPFPVRQVPLLHGGVKVTLCLGKKVS